jgi:hypothetical protein
LYPGFSEAAESVGKFRAGRIKNGQMIKSGGMGRRRRSTGAFPSVEADVMVIAPGGKECRLVSVALGNVESKDVMVKGKGAVEVGHLQMNMANSDLWVNRTRAGSGVRFHRADCLGE